MRILSHRGYWKQPEEKNTLTALERSFAFGFGTETDLRDQEQRIVVSHDMPLSSTLSFEAVLESRRSLGPDLMLALNIKADGLHVPLKALLERFGLNESYFLFDMSIPDALASLRHGLRIFTRQSEEERECALYDESQGVWMDGFYSDWVDESAIASHLRASKQVCIVSPELHGRDHRPFWQRLAASSAVAGPDVMLCTDFPEQARDAFQA